MISVAGDLHYGKSPPAEEEHPNLSYKLPMKEPRTKKEGIVVVIDDDASCRTGLKELFESVGLEVKLYASVGAFLGGSPSRRYLLLGARCKVARNKWPQTSRATGES